MKLWIFAVLLLTVVSAVEKRAQKCYGNLGCFSTFKGFNAIPEGPDVIKTEFLLYTRNSRTKPVTIAAADEKNWNSHLHSFSASKPTKFIIHGFLNSGKTAWVGPMKDALLSKGDFNVFVVNWGHGSSPPYSQAAANTFLVAAQVSRFILHLKSSNHVNLNSVHLIGHSLGAQIAGNAGAAARGIGRITGLDPAEPDFINFHDSQRLDKSDASFVDVIHTDGEKFNLVKGYGMMQPVGDIDFYPNGGQDQPGCTDHPVSGIIGSLLGGHGGQSFSCSHGRALRFFTESINAGSCRFTSHSCKNWATYETGTCHGCPAGGCPVMGYDADKTSARGSFYLSTTEKNPFCGHEYFVEIDLASVNENVYGRLYLTLVGSKGSSGEFEFTREDRHYHKGDHEKHMVALPHDLGTLTQATVKFEKGGGLGALGSDKEIIISRVLVRNADSSHQDKFCANNVHIQDDKTTTLKSHSGC